MKTGRQFLSTTSQSSLFLAYFHKHAVAVVALLCSYSLFAEEELKVPVLVTASRYSETADKTLADVVVLTREDLDQASALNEILARQSEMYVSTNGGPGKSSTLYIRGSNQVVVLVDGQRYGSASTGAAAIEQIPLAQIERIEILKGAASSLYGVDAVGGVVNIFTRKSQDVLFAADASSSYGTYHTRYSDAGLTAQHGVWRTNLRGSCEGSDGYKSIPDESKQPFSYDSSRPRDGYNNCSVAVGVNYSVAKNNNVAANYLRTRGRNDYEAGENARAYADSAQEVVGLRWNKDFLDFWTSTVSIGQSEDISQNITSVSDDYFRTIQQQAGWQNDLRSRFGRFLVGFEGLEQQVKQKSGDATTMDRSRTISSILGNWQQEFGMHQLQLAYRLDQNSQFGGHGSGHARYGLNFTPQWRFLIGVGQAVRAPSFNELYYPNYGVDTLRVQKSVEHEAGLHWRQDVTSAHVEYFHRRVKDLIQTSCDANFNCSPANIGRATLSGVEFAAETRLRAFTFSAGATLMKAQDDVTGFVLPRSPSRQANLSVNYNAKPWLLGVSVIGTGATYDSENQVNRLPGYALLNVSVSYEMSAQARLFIRGANLTNQRYETAWGYAEPGATVTVGLKVQTP